MSSFMAFFSRLVGFQPTTWFLHLLVAELVWLAIDFTPKWGTVLLLGLAVGVFGYREYLNYHEHKKAGQKMRRWIGDGIGDMIGPLTVLWSAMWDPWYAHTFGLYIMGLGTIAWVGLGYGGKDAPG